MAKTDSQMRNDYTFAQLGHVTIEVADVPSSGDPAYNPLGCIVGDFTVNDSYATETDEPFENWCAIQERANNPGDAIAQARLGQRTIEFSPTVEVDLSDEVFRDEYTAYTSGDDRAYRITWVNENGDEWEQEFVGKYTAWNTNARSSESLSSGTAQADISFHVNEVATDEFTPDE